MKESIHERLKRARLNLSLSQDYVAKKMNVHRTTIVAIEKGTRNITAKDISFFSNLYGLTTDYLINGDMDNDEVKMFARAYKELSENDKKEIMNLIKFKKQLKENRM